MAHRYADIAFTDSVKAIQSMQGSRALYARRDAAADSAGRLDADAREFIETRDGFYLATVSETGWPYVQFRGGPRGFLKTTGEAELGFADFRGNRQYLSAGNIAGEDRVSLFLMDYPSQRRLKLFGRMRSVERNADPRLVDSLARPDYPAFVERAFLIRVEAFDWNCPRHITPRFTVEEILSEPAIRTRVCAGVSESAELGEYYEEPRPHRSRNAAQPRESR